MSRPFDPGLAGQSSPASPPELDESSYVSQVLRISRTKSESWVEDELEARALHLGLSLSRHSTPFMRNNNSSSKSTSTVASDSAPGRSGSIVSHESISTTLTNHSASSGLPAAKSKSKSGPQVQSQISALNYSEYDQILTRRDSIASSPPAPFPELPRVKESAPSIFSLSRRRSLLAFPSEFKDRLRRRRSTLTFTPARYGSYLHTA
jgi:hypothetical protein